MFRHLLPQPYHVTARGRDILGRRPATCLPLWRSVCFAIIIQYNTMHGAKIDWKSELCGSQDGCSSSGFPCVGVRLVYWSLRSTATFVICFHWSLLFTFSLHFSSSSAFLRSLFTQSSHLSCGLPRFLEPSCFFVSALFGSLSSFIRTMCPAHFIILPTMVCDVKQYFFNVTSLNKINS